MDRGPKRKNSNYKLSVEENRGDRTLDLAMDRIPKAQGTIGETDKLDFIKIKLLYITDTFKKVKKTNH